MTKPVFNNKAVEAVFEAYPRHVRPKLLALRQLIHETAAEIDGLEALEETLKWGQPAYLTRPKLGTTVRIDWKPKSPQQYAMYVHCQTTLVDTFRELFGDTFSYEGNRAIVFKLDETVPVTELKYCIMLSLTYHRSKHR